MSPQHATQAPSATSCSGLASAMGGLTTCSVSAFLRCAQDQLTACTGTYVEETLMQRFGALIAFVRAAEATSQGAGDGRGEAAGSLAATAVPVLRDFSGRWMGEIEALSKCASPDLAMQSSACCAAVAGLTHNPSCAREVVKDFRSSACGREVLKATMTQLLLYYTRMLELLKRAGADAAALTRDAVTVPSIMYEIKKFNR